MRFNKGQEIIDILRGKYRVINNYPQDIKDSIEYIDNIEEKSFYDIYSKHKGLLSDKWEQYLHVYNKHFRHFIDENKPVNLLEIGVFKGGSLELWGEYLPENSKIIGIDINPECADIKFNNENIEVIIGSASDKDFINKHFKDAKFDIIIDDGSHICSDVITSFEEFFPKLNYGGIYIVEDLHTSYWPKYEGGYYNKNSSINYFKDIIDSLNFDYINIFNPYKTKLNIIEKYYKEKQRRMKSCLIGTENLSNGETKEHKYNKFERFFK